MLFMLIATIALGGVLTAVGMQSGIGWLVAIGFLTMAGSVVGGLNQAANASAAEAALHGDAQPVSGEAPH